MDLKAAFPGKYIKAADLAGKTKIVTITGVEYEKVGEEEKPVLRYEEGDQGLVLNLTNTNTITDIFGSSDSDNWIGGRIELYPAKVQFGAKMVDAIRVRMVGEDDDSPFEK